MTAQDKAVDLDSPSIDRGNLEYILAGVSQ